VEKFTRLTGIAAPLAIPNVDTDMIIPKQYLKTIQRTGLGRHLFDEMRFTPEGEEIAGFVLNQEPYRRARILIAGENFGCGSSREHAPWALLDFGIRAVIAPSYADIFYNNCAKNGILAVTLPPESVAILMADAEAGLEITVDLERQQVSGGNQQAFQFELDPFRRHCLLSGLDEIGLTLEKSAAIASFEDRQRLAEPWLYR